MLLQICHEHAVPPWSNGQHSISLAMLELRVEKENAYQVML
jgi:hypothetical protein